MWYTIILLSIALAVSVGFWVKKADRMAGRWHAKILKLIDQNQKFSDEYEETITLLDDRIDREKDARLAALDIAQSYKSDLETARRQLAAARGQITKLRRKYGETE